MTASLNQAAAANLADAIMIVIDRVVNGPPKPSPDAFRSCMRSKGYVWNGDVWTDGVHSTVGPDWARGNEVGSNPSAPQP
jgi:hypothetical protein